MIWAYHYIDKDHKRIGIAWFGSAKAIPKSWSKLDFGRSSTLNVGLSNGTTAVLQANSGVAEILGKPSQGSGGAYVNTGLIKGTAKQVEQIPTATLAFAVVSLSYGYGLAGSGAMMLLNSIGVGVFVPLMVDKNENQQAHVQGDYNGRGRRQRS